MPKPCRSVVVAFAIAALLGSGAAVAAQPGGAPVAAPASRHLMVIGDSIALGARPALVPAFERAGWTVGYDAETNRSTLAGAGVVARHAPDLDDTLLISLGANDGGNPTTFRQRVDDVMAAASSVPHVYWLTVREVRPYYAAVNRVLREAAGAHPNLKIIDWNAATTTATGITAPDGLHLTPAGAGGMAFLVAGTVLVDNTGPVAADTVPTTTVPTTAPAPTTGAVPDATVATAADPASGAASASPNTSTPVPATTMPGAALGVRRLAARLVRRGVASDPQQHRHGNGCGRRRQRPGLGLGSARARRVRGSGLDRLADGQQGPPSASARRSSPAAGGPGLVARGPDRHPGGRTA